MSNTATSTIEVRKPRLTDVFASTVPKVWRHRFEIEMLVTNLTGGVPSDPKIAEGWLRAKLTSPDIALETVIAETMVERGIERDDAVEEFIKGQSINGFKVIDGVLVIEGRQAKAAVKEAINVALAGGHFGDTKRWGATSKGTTGFVAEHIMVPERYIPILDENGVPVTAATGINQRFVHTHRGSALSYEQYVDPAALRFTVMTDWDFGKQVKDFWPIVWTIGGRQGIGATRSQGCGVYMVTQWDELS